MVQHAPLEYQDAWLPLMEQALRDGLADPGELAYLQDRVNMRHDRPQAYGSQSWGSGSSEVRLWPVTDPATLNARRAQVGLPPLDDEIIASAWTPDQLREHGCRLAEDQDGRLTPACGPRVLPEPVEVSGPSTAEVLDELRADRL